MLDTDVVRAIEAIVMVATEPVRTELMAQLLELPTADIEAICVELARTYEFQTHPDMAPYVERFVLDGQRARLSGAALETLAIIAYKQPISRMQIASIRGVDPDAVMRTLHGRAYIAPVGRDAGPGQAVMWGTTQLFLEKLGIATLNDMPPIASFVPDASIVETLEKTLRAAAEVEELAAAGESGDGISDAGE